MELHREGGIAKKGARYQANHRALLELMSRYGFLPLLEAEMEPPIITAFCYPSEPFDFERFYQVMKQGGFVLYPRKISRQPTFRIDTIGDVQPADIQKMDQSLKVWEGGHAFSTLC